MLIMPLSPEECARNMTFLVGNSTRYCKNAGCDLTIGPESKGRHKETGNHLRRPGNGRPRCNRDVTVFPLCLEIVTLMQLNSSNSSSEAMGLKKYQSAT